MAVTINGSTGVQLDDNDKQQFGTGDDLEIFHNGSGSKIHNNTGRLDIEGDQISFWNHAGDEALADFNANGACELYYDNAHKLITDTNGIKVYGPEGGDGSIKLMADEGDDNADVWLMKAWQASSTFSIQNYNAGSYHNSIVCNGGGNVKLYYNNNEVVQTHTAGLLINQHYAIYFVAGDWTGDTTGKIQAHSSHLYLVNPSNSGNWIFRLPNGTEPANINSSGTYSGSDERRKKDITTITNAVSTVKQLTGRSFTWKETDEKSFGVIAQEIEPVLPDIVTTQSVPEGTTDPDPYKMVNYAALSGHFIEAIKELSAEVETLKTKVAALEAA